MPLYRVVCDGTDILDYSSKDLVLLAPDLELEINTAGSFEFVMPPYHRYYDIVQMFTSTIEVYEDEECIWFGRPVEEKIDFYKQKKIYCEGPLSFFNDTVQRQGEFNQISLERFFKDTITRHNQQIDDPNRQFVCYYRMGTDYVYRKLDYESTYDVLTGMCLDTNGGYLFFGRADGVNYIEWRKDMPYTCNQSIQFGLNLLNYSSSFDGSDFATCILPLGESSRDEVTGEDTYVTIADINGGDDVLRSEAADTYGTIIKVERWSDYTSPHDLLMDAQKWLEDTQFNASSIECSAADLHSKDGNYELFRVGQMVHCVSNPHLVDKDFPLSKMSLRLDSAVKIITLGIIKRKTLTRIYKKDIEDASQYDPEQYYPEDYGGYDDYDPGVIPDENGDLWELRWPEGGGQVTAERMPTHITVARNPNKMNYKNGETIDYTGLLVNIWCNDKIWTNPPRYLDGRAPMAELSFSSKTAWIPPTAFTDSWDHTIVITWKYKGKEYKTKLVVHVGTADHSFLGKMKTINPGQEVFFRYGLVDRPSGAEPQNYELYQSNKKSKKPIYVACLHNKDGLYCGITISLSNDAYFEWKLRNGGHGESKLTYNDQISAYYIIDSTSSSHDRSKWPEYPLIEYNEIFKG